MSQQIDQNQNERIYISFFKRNQINSQLQRQNKLKINSLRIITVEKQKLLGEVLKLGQKDLYDLFQNYELFQESPFVLEQLTQSQKSCLIRKNSYIYFGQMKDKEMSGIGIYINSEQNCYEGTFVGNKKEGFGCEVYQNGDLYIGEFSNNKKHGKGIQYFFAYLNTSNSKNLQCYEGQWWGGLPDGKGTYRKSNGKQFFTVGDLYKGFFKNGLKHGTGAQKYGNGDYYIGQYVNGQPEGVGQYCWHNSSFYKGDFKQGLRNGFGYWKQNKQENSDSYEGHYSMDKKSGYGIYQWGSGWVYKGNFENDLREGFGQLSEKGKCRYRGNWRKGLRQQETYSNATKVSPFKLNPQSKKYQSADITQIDCSRLNHQYIGDSKHQLLARPYQSQRNSASQSKTKNMKGSRKKNKNNEQQAIVRVGTAIQRPLAKTKM